MAANERKILTTLSIGGEKEFKAAMDNAYRGVKVLSSELKTNATEFDKNNKSVEGLTKRGELLRKEISQQKEIVNALSKAVDESAEAYGEDSKKTDEYRIKLNNAQAALSNMERDLKENNKTLSDAKSKTKALADGLKEFGDKATETGKKIEDVGKKVSVLSAAAAAMAAAAAKVTVDSGKWGDELLTLSAKTGISTETLQKWTYAAKFIDTEVDTMTGSMVKMVKQMDAARNGTKLSAEAFAKLGIKVTDSNGNLRDSQTVFFEAIDALGKMTNETDRDALALQVFGKSAQELNPLIKAGSDELKRLGEEAEATGVIIGDDGVKKLGKFDDMMQRMNSQIDASKNKLAIQLAPTFELIGEKITDVIGKFGEWVATLDSGTVETILKVLAVTAAVGPLLIVIGKLSQGIGVVSSALSFLIANPVALTIVAVVAVTAAIIAWSKSMEDSNSVANVMSKKAKERTSEIKEQKTAYNNLKTAQAEQAEGDLAQLRNVENLRDELKNLVTAQGNVADKDKARVSYILNEINEAYGTELTLIGNNITGYQDQMAAIDQLVEKRKYEVVQKAALPLFEKAITDEIKLRMDAERDLSILEEAKAEREKQYTELVDKYGQERLDKWTFYDDGVAQINAAAALEYNTLNTTILDLEASYAASTEAVKSNLSDQTSYQQAELAAQQGNYEAAYATLNWYSSGLAQKYQELRGDETAQRQFLENEYLLADAALTTYLNNVLLGVEEYNESTVRSLTANATDLYNKAKEGGINVGDGLIAGIDQKQPGVTTSITSIGNAVVNGLKTKMGIKSPSTVMKGLGQNIVQGLEDGMNSKSESASETASGIGSLLVKTFKNIFGIKSPSTVMRDQIGKQMMQGWANGIEDNKKLVSGAIDGVVPDTLNSALSLDVTRNFYDVARSAATYEPARRSQSSVDSAASIIGALPPVQLTINLDGKKIGQGTAKYVSDAIANKATVKMRSGLLANV